MCCNMRMEAEYRLSISERTLAMIDRTESMLAWNVVAACMCIYACVCVQGVGACMYVCEAFICM